MDDLDQIEQSVDTGAVEVEREQKDTHLLKLRSYQDEMLEESLKRNTIVVLNTGAGKTHVAIARTSAELEFGNTEQLVWVLAPTVALCHQHHRLFETSLPVYPVRILTSEDGVDRWTDQATWDGVLKNMRIVISTYGVLYDALCHGFVNMQRLSLCVFDEAHHCMKKHPSNMIMQHFYRPAKAARQPVPKILGLSASPVVNAKTAGLELLEANLDSHVITPRLHRSELMQFVHIPELTKRVYNNTDGYEDLAEGSILGALRGVIGNYNIRSDPYVTEILKAEEGPGDLKKLEKVLVSKKTYCTEQLLALRLRAEAIASNVSLAASDAYIRSCCGKFLAGIKQNTTLWMPELSDKEKIHLARILTDLQDKANISLPSAPSPKLQLLLDILRQEAGDSFTGIVFVEQRAVVAALSDYLISTPEFADRFKIGTFVGGSSSSRKKANIGDINDVKEQQQTLDAFREGKKNLIISTSVLEEGIDVSSCQTVICFDAPSNLVSFVQRRGRARQKESKYIVLLADGDKKAEPAKWHDLEDQMKAAYEDELRNAQLATEIESIAEDDGREYKVDSTGALLTLDNAKSHLYHFCATLRRGNYVDPRPTFSCHTDSAELVVAEVRLPSCVHQKYRKAKSSRSWRTERAAIKDAAFEALVTLHRGGLLNEHLLPLAIITPGQERHERPSLVQVSTRVCSWSMPMSNTWYEHSVEVQIPGQADATMLMLLPFQCPHIPDITLYWSPTVTGTARVRFNQPRVLDEVALDEGQRKTGVLLRSVLRSFSDNDGLANYAVLFEPQSGNDTDCFDGQSLPAKDVLSKGLECLNIGLVRPRNQPGRAFAVKDVVHPMLELVSFPRKRDFLDPRPQMSRKSQQTALKCHMDDCLVDTLHAKYAFFAACVPSILRRVEDLAIANELRQTILEPVGLGNLQLIHEAVTSGSADPVFSYERLEFLGDSVLKYLTHVQLTAQHAEWPESYLTAEKGRTNGNTSLYKAALRTGLERYICTTRFTTNQWKPPFLPDARKDQSATIERSTKTLADVVESLIGASFVEKGLDGSLACIKLFLPDEEWFGLADCHHRLLEHVPATAAKSSTIDLLQDLIGYRFERPTLLLEATTHASHASNETPSYERLEFLGDSVLDQIIVSELAAHRPPLKNHQMHDLRQSLANAYMLGFCCMELAVDQERSDPPARHHGEGPPFLARTSHRFRLLDFLRCSPEIRGMNQAASVRHGELRGKILHALGQQPTYPWPDLLALDCPKWLSDLVEAILGAVYVDSGGSLGACRGFAARCGVTGLLRGFLLRGVQTAYPSHVLGRLADKQTVTYGSEPTETDLEDGAPRTWRCAVGVGGEVVAAVEGCRSRDEAEARGAAEAVYALGVRAAAGKRKLEVDGDGDAETL